MCFLMKKVIVEVASYGMIISEITFAEAVT